MKQLGAFSKIVFWTNVFFALLLLISFVLPYLPPSTFPTLAILSLGVSPLILINIIFAVFWVFKLKKQFLLSTIVLVIAFFHFNPFLEISSEGDTSQYNELLSVMSYNVRLFNAYEAKPDRNAEEVLSEILTTKKPDVLSIQEYYRESQLGFHDYPYQYIHYKDGNNKLGHAILSKYPIVNQGAFDFKDSYNNALYADIVKGSDTIRVYNLHLQSLGILPRLDYLQDGNKDRLRKRMANAFKKQEYQTKIILTHKESSPYPVIINGDFNNTPFSYIYRRLQDGMKDGFLERGSGLGTTFTFDSYPMRIDYILTESDFDIVRFETVDNSFSDHYPVYAILGWNKK
ncbi:endonuclease/exonuclease/phosphatase family protein [Constantimarinum furrinae]|uniref:Endonuclease n=1 Tax=Constantimarinum furrinae TaxID=2562285 RepID=A0A7G8PVN5_9FLAO|nr:endonuclease/exonuclease/phosphatase family protein [Constantimarinum furrinae]QNJ98401.1 endonuclease [Constantimarinum furrinae]